MNSNRSRHIAIGLVIVFILYVLVTAGKEENLKEYTGTYGPVQSQPSSPSIDSERTHPTNTVNLRPQTDLNRQEILKTNVKGYREATYWGSEHPVDEKTRYYSNDEFDRYIEEEVEMKDVDVYWGAEY